MVSSRYPTVHIDELEPAQAAVLTTLGDVKLTVPGGFRPFLWKASAVPLGPAVFTHSESGADATVSGVTSRFMLCIPQRGQARVSQGKDEVHLVKGSGLALISPTRNVTWKIVGQGGSRIIGIEPSLIQAQMHALTGENITKPVTFALELPIDSNVGAWFHQLVQLVHDTIDEGFEPVAHAALTTSLIESVARALLLAQPHDHSHFFARSAKASSPRLVRLAEEYIDAHAAQPIQIADLARVTGQSLQALEAAFVAHRGTTPAAHLRKRRLELAREMLLLDPKATAMQAAHAAGFLQKNSFENAYLKAFGETPSQTRQRGIVTKARPATGAGPAPIAQSSPVSSRDIVFVVSADDESRHFVVRSLQQALYDVRSCDSVETFWAALGSTRPHCVLADMHLPNRNGVQWQQEIAAAGQTFPVVFMCKKDEAREAILVMKSGAADVLVEPFDAATLLDSVKRIAEREAKARAEQAERDLMSARLRALSTREREVCALAARGLLNKQIAAELGISEVTVKIHRARGMERLGVQSLAELSVFMAKVGQNT